MKVLISTKHPENKSCLVIMQIKVVSEQNLYFFLLIKVDVIVIL